MSCSKHGWSICAPAGICPATARTGHLLWKIVRSSVSLIPLPGAREDAGAGPAALQSIQIVSCAPDVLF